jgi:hypothetical protein
VRRVVAEVMTALAVGEGERVGHAHTAHLGGERRLGDEGSGEVAALDVVGARRADRPVAGVRAEQAREHRRAVIARQAEPVDRAPARDERGRVAVREQGVIADREARSRRVDGREQGVSHAPESIKGPTRYVTKSRVVGLVGHEDVH